jgi:hypothetical protein
MFHVDKIAAEHKVVFTGGDVLESSGSAAGERDPPTICLPHETQGMHLTSRLMLSLCECEFGRWLDL